MSAYNKDLGSPQKVVWIARPALSYHVCGYWSDITRARAIPRPVPLPRPRPSEKPRVIDHQPIGIDR
jgi:hypothetical protein